MWHASGKNITTKDDVEFCSASISYNQQFIDCCCQYVAYLAFREAWKSTPQKILHFLFYAFFFLQYPQCNLPSDSSIGEETRKPFMLNFCKFDIEKCCSSASCNKKCNFKNTFLKMMSAAINSLGMSWCNSSFVMNTDASMSDDFFSRDKSPGIKIKQLSVSYKHFNQCDFQGQIKGACLVFWYTKIKIKTNIQQHNTPQKKGPLHYFLVIWKDCPMCNRK